MSRNVNLHAAKRGKLDEFYTQLGDIENELRHYEPHFKGKVVYCNCDDPRVSQFFEYFSSNFEFLGLKKLITTCYKNQEWDLFSRHDSERAIYLEYHGDQDGDLIVGDDEVTKKHLWGDGDFRSAECIKLLKEADIVVTNPPFSLFREYVAQLMEYNKKFLIIGPRNAITYKEIFPLIKENKIWLGNHNVSSFVVPGDNGKSYLDEESGRWFQKFGNVGWYTNLPHAKRHEELILYKKYSLEEYPHYDNYDAIEVSKTKDIPRDWPDAMGVPITFLDRYNPDQFEILGITKTWFGAATKVYPKQVQVSANGARSKVTKLNDGASLQIDRPCSKTYYIVDGCYYTQKYARILIRNRKVDHED